MKKLAILLALILLLGTSPALAAFNESGLPIVNEPFEFTIMVDGSTLPEDILMLEVLNTETGVTAKLQTQPYQVMLETMGIALNTGAYPEVIGGWLLGRQDIIDLSSDGTIIPLEALIDKYCPNIKEALDIPGVRDAFTLPDGHIYTIPYVIEAPKVGFLPFINEKWLDNLNLEMPTTPAELKEVLIAFRDNDANGNGDATDEIPFSGDPNNLNITLLAGWWGVDAYSGGDYPYHAIVDGDIVFNGADDAVKEMVLFFADLYKEGLIDTELFTQDLAMWKAKGDADRYGVSIAYGPGDFYKDYEPSDDPVYGKNDFTHLPVLLGVENPVFHRGGYGVDMFRTQVVLTDKCDEETAAIILRWFDNSFTRDNSAQIQWGPFDIRLKKESDQLYLSTDDSEWDQAKKDKYSWGNYYAQSLPKFLRADMKLAPETGIIRQDEKKEADAAYEPFLNTTFTPVWGADEEANARAGILRTDITTYIKGKVAQWISGEADVNAEWDAYKAQLTTYGIEELTSIYRAMLFGE